MTDINSVLAGLVGSGVSKDVVSLSKKNAWKSEWEKAQLDTLNNAGSKTNTNGEKGSSTNTEQAEPSNEFNASSYNNSKTGIVVVENKNSVPELLAGIVVDKNAVSTRPVVVKSQNLPTSQINSASLNALNNFKPSNVQALKQGVYVQGLLDKTSAKFTAAFKPQNLNLLVVDNGVKMILRDYRLDKTQLNQIVEEVTRYLSEFGVAVKDVIVNGVKHEET